jgi:hypothetical protein
VRRTRRIQSGLPHLKAEVQFVRSSAFFSLFHRQLAKRIGNCGAQFLKKSYDSPRAHREKIVIKINSGGVTRFSLAIEFRLGIKTCQLAVFSGRLSSMEAEIEDKLPSNSS